MKEITRTKLSDLYFKRYDATESEIMEIVWLKAEKKYQEAILMINK